MKPPCLALRQGNLHKSSVILASGQPRPLAEPAQAGTALPGHPAAALRPRQLVSPPASDAAAWRAFICRRKRRRRAGGLVGQGPGCPLKPCRGCVGAGSSATKRDSMAHGSPLPPPAPPACRSVPRGQLITPGLCPLLPSSQSWTGAVTPGPHIPGCHGPVGDTRGVAAAGRGTGHGASGGKLRHRGQRPGGAGTALPQSRWRWR